MHRLCLVAALFSVACNVSVQQGLDENAANEVMSALERAGVSARKVNDGGDPPRFSVAVAQSEAPSAIAMLNARGLPRGVQAGFGQAYGEPSLIPTPLEERARFLRALTGEIEHTLMSADGIVSARVHVVPEERDAMARLDEPHVPARAAVLLKVEAGAKALTDAQVASLVAGSVAGLTPAAVAVVRTEMAEERKSSHTLVPVGPLRVAAASRLPLVLGMATAGFVVATLAVLLLLAARKLAARSGA
ncbi:MAG: hypothetical protein SF187_27075 [Deltaproteobacteria bacterium]|nr:hypothetical protein [Deltaproteobacteria bacterium]